MAILLRLGFTRQQFQALPWTDQRMYMEQLIIMDYEQKKENYDALSEEQKWEYEEPEMPLVAQIDQELIEWEDGAKAPLPDILGMVE